MTRRHYFFILAALAVFVMLGEEYLPTFQAVSFKKKQQAAETDFYLENMHSTVMLKDGTPNYRMSAARLTHYPEDDLVKVEKVVFELFRPDQANWSAQANQGTIENRQNRVHLLGKVILHHPASADSEAIRLTTDELFIYTDKNLVETSAKVEIESGKNLISATGMRLYIKEGRMEFLSSTRVRYHVPGL